MQKIICLSLLSFIAASFLGTGFAATPIVYPAKGQSQDQMEQDKFQCHQWATQQTGFDPMQQPQATSAPPQQEGAGLVGGAARGAALGAVGGAIAGDAGTGAAIGAAAGGLFGGMRRRDSERKQEEWAQQQAAHHEQQRSTFNRAFATCLEGRGYSVSM